MNSRVFRAMAITLLIGSIFMGLVKPHSELARHMVGFALAITALAIFVGGLFLDENR